MVWCRRGLPGPRLDALLRLADLSQIVRGIIRRPRDADRCYAVLGQSAAVTARPLTMSSYGCQPRFDAEHAAEVKPK